MHDGRDGFSQELFIHVRREFFNGEIQLPGVLGNDLFPDQLFRQVHDPFRDHPKGNDGVFAFLADDFVKAIGDGMGVHSESVDFHGKISAGISAAPFLLRVGVRR